MIEMIYRGNDGNGNDGKKLPKNVRQIGEAGKGKKIYLEDYAITYLHQAEAAVILGETWEKDGSKYIFIHGAICVDDPEFGDEIWEGVYRDAREYFGDSEILGWAMQVQEQPQTPDARINRIFKAHFDREDAVLLLCEPTEKEDAVFTAENGALKKAGGYYVYYDKNKSMQEYMICKNEGKSVEKEAKVEDKAIKNFRKRSEEKKEPEKQPRNARFLYAASSFLVLTILIIGVTMISNYEKMKNMEMALSDMAKNTEEALDVNAQAQAFGETEAMQSVENETASGETEAMQGAENETASGETEGTQSAENETDMDGMAALEELQHPENTARMEEGTVNEAASSADGTAAYGEDSYASETTDAEQASSAAVRPSQASYTVKAGDTLEDICRMYYGSDEKLEALCTLNAITDPNRIVPGQKIKLP